MRQFENRTNGYWRANSRRVNSRYFKLRSAGQRAKLKKEKKARDAYRVACGIEPEKGKQ